MLLYAGGGGRGGGDEGLWQAVREHNSAAAAAATAVVVSGQDSENMAIHRQNFNALPLLNAMCDGEETGDGGRKCVEFAVGQARCETVPSCPFVTRNAAAGKGKLWRLHREASLASTLVVFSAIVCVRSVRVPTFITVNTLGAPISCTTS